MRRLLALAFVLVSFGSMANEVDFKGEYVLVEGDKECSDVVAISQEKSCLLVSKNSVTVEEICHINNGYVIDKRMEVHAPGVVKYVSDSQISKLKEGKLTKKRVITKTNSFGVLESNTSYSNTFSLDEEGILSYSYIKVSLQALSVPAYEKLDCSYQIR